MNWFSKQVGRYFKISRREANGIVLLTPIILAALFVPLVIKRYYRPAKSEIALNRFLLDSLVVEFEEEAVAEKLVQKVRRKKKNKLPLFKKKEWPKKVTNSNVDPFDINDADTVQLKKIYGIGSVLANRIVKYRDLLGGFVHKEQLGEVYNLSDSVLQALDTIVYIDSSTKIHRMAINGSSAKDLMRHPYINGKMAWAIVNYRVQHDSFTDVNQIRSIHLLDQATSNKIIPYLSLQTEE